MDINTLVENHRTANPFVIADNLNINYLYVDFPSRLKGRIIVTNDGEPIILLNNSLKNSNEKYLVMAHELGHAVLHYNTSTPHLLSMKYRYTSKIESEADEFASILMEQYSNDSLDF